MSARPQQNVGENLGVAVGRDHHGPVNIYHKDNEPSTSECLRLLLLTDPREDRVQILRRKDELLPDSCDWVYHDEAFIAWWSSKQAEDRLLWLHGDAGKGKTMIMIALGDEIARRIEDESQSTPSIAIAYYFCQSASTSTNSAQSVIRGLIYFLVTEHKHLAEHVIERYRATGSKLFEGAGNLDGLWRLLREVCADPSLGSVYLLVDALDECDSGLDDLLKMMSRSDLALPNKVKWLVSSRNESQISRALAYTTDRPHISLEVNADRVSKAIERYIEVKVRDRQFLESVGTSVANAIHSYLLTHANGTFLWVWLVCQQLQSLEPWDDALTEVRKFPSGLHEVYARMSWRIKQSKAANYCFAILGAAEITSRPMTLDEAWFVAGLPEQHFRNRKAILNLVKQCASFFVVRDEIITFVHKSASDYLRSPSAVSLSSLNIGRAHTNVCQRSFELMASSLRQDMCGLSSPGTLIDDVSLSLVNQSIPVELQYACRYWSHHLQNSLWPVSNGPSSHESIGLLEKFLEERLIYWIECMSLLRDASLAIRALVDVEAQLTHLGLFNDYNLELVHGARRFVSEFRSCIEIAPLQVYQAGLLFCPERSFIPHNFHQLKDKIMTISPAQSQWGPCTHVLEAASALVSVAVSPDGKQLVSESGGGELQVWNMSTGELMHELGEQANRFTSNTLELSRQANRFTSMTFSPDGKLLVYASLGRMICVWDAIYWQPLHLFADHSAEVLSAFFSPDSKQVAWLCRDGAVRLWDLSTGHLLHTLAADHEWFKSLVFSQDGTSISTSSVEGTVRIWNVSTGQSTRKLSRKPFVNTVAGISPDSKRIVLTGYESAACIQNMETGVPVCWLEDSQGLWDLVTFSPDTKLLAAVIHGYEGQIRVWDALVGRALLTLVFPHSPVRKVLFSPNNEHIAGFAGSSSFYVCDNLRDGTLHILSGHMSVVNDIEFSPDGQRLVSAALDHTIRIWDFSRIQDQDKSKSHSKSIFSLMLSADRKRLVTVSHDQKVCIWDSTTGQLINEFPHHSVDGTSTALSPDGELITSIFGKVLRVWSVTTGNEICTLEVDTWPLSSVSFSIRGRYLASASLDGSIHIWDVSTWNLLHWLDDMSEHKSIRFKTFSTVVFSADDQQLLYASAKRVDVWNISTGSVLQKLQFQSACLCKPMFSPDGKQIVSVCYDGTVRFWDVLTGWCLHSLEANAQAFWPLVFSQHGSQMASVSHDGTIIIWNYSTATMIRRIENVLLSSSLQLKYLLGWDKDNMCDDATGNWVAHMSIDKRWLIRKGQRLLWIPHSFRPENFFSTSQFAVMCSISGRVTFVMFRD